MAAHADPVAAVGAGDGRLILVDLAVAVVVQAVARFVACWHARDAVGRQVRRVLDRQVGRRVHTLGGQVARMIGGGIGPGGVVGRLQRGAPAPDRGRNAGDEQDPHAGMDTAAPWGRK